MAEKTEISWTDATFNPWWGCQKVSPACDHCYAERDAKRFAAGKVLWGVGSERRIFDVTTPAGKKHWDAPLTWAKTMPAKLGRRPRVFCASMGDVFDKDASHDERVRLFDLIERTPELDWLLLTKRIGNVKAYMPITWREGQPNVWLGATVVNQEEADRDIPKLLDVRARVRFLSIEPMLGPIDLTNVPLGGGHGHHEFDPIITGNPLRRAQRDDPSVHWVIAGGESGPHARPPRLAWFRSLRDQCAAAGVPYHLKQVGEYSVHDIGPDGEIEPPSSMSLRGIKQWREDLGRFSDVPKDAMADEVFTPGGSFALPVGKKAAGRLLDGVEHNGFPA